MGEDPRGEVEEVEELEEGEGDDKATGWEASRVEMGTIRSFLALP